MDDLANLKIIKIGNLKYDRLKSISILNKNLHILDYHFNLKDVKELFVSLLEDKYEECFNRKFQYCVDSIFDNTEYDEVIKDQYNEQNFPDDWIPPIGCL